MATRTCAEDGCTRTKIQARGFCATHYSYWYRRTHVRDRSSETHAITCTVCGVEYQHSRPDGKFCSIQCKGDAYRTTRTICPLPRNHQVRLIIRLLVDQRRPHPKPLGLVECGWCGASFRQKKAGQRMCDARCRRRAKMARRRGRQHGWASHYTWTEVIKLHLTFDKCCAYCDAPVHQPEPDHVVPLSRGGANSITNILPCCPLCNSDKRDLLLTEWADDRRRRGLAQVRTTWSPDDPRFRHLTSVLIAA